MATYAIYLRPGEPAEKAVFVKEGFSVAAAAFTVFWALWNRMWIVAAVMFAAFAILSLLIAELKPGAGVAMAINTAAGLVTGWLAAGLRQWSLRNAGYREDGLAEASSLEAAELKYFLSAIAPRTRATVAPAASGPIPPAQNDPLGLFGNV